MNLNTWLIWEGVSITSRCCERIDSQVCLFPIWDSIWREDIFTKIINVFHISGFASSGITVKFTTTSFGLFRTTSKGLPTLSPIISTICHAFMNYMEHQHIEEQRHIKNCNETLIFQDLFLSKYRNQSLTTSIIFTNHWVLKVAALKYFAV